MAAIDLKVLLNVPADLDKRSSDALIKAIKDNYQSDFDYLKFLSSVKTLQGMGIDEETSFRSAFATAKTMGFTKEEFKQSVMHYKRILTSQMENFAEAFQRQKEDKLENRVEKNQEIEKRINTNKEKIKKLQAEIEILEKKIATADETLEKERTKLETIRTNFVSSYQFFDEKLKQDLNLFEKYI